MSRTITARVLLAPCRALLIACAAASAAPSDAAPLLEAGELAPSLVGTDLAGEPVSLAAFRGKVVVLSFWASWCGPCLKELPILDGIQKAAGKNRLQVVATNIESVDTYRRLARRLSDFELVVAHDHGKAASEAYGVHGIPHMVIIGRDGRIVRVNRGYDESGLDRIVDDINRALAAR